MRTLLRRVYVRESCFVKLRDEHEAIRLAAAIDSSAIAVGHVIEGEALAAVVESRSPSYAAGDSVHARTAADARRSECQQARAAPLFESTL